jgi:hypothetical protein
MPEQIAAPEDFSVFLRELNLLLDCFNKEVSLEHLWRLVG